MPPLAEVVRALDELYDPRLAESWDAVGLVCGDPAAPVRRILFAVDPVPAVAAEAIGWGADLVVTHHPLLLRPVHGVPATTPKGRVVHDLIRHGVGLHVCHTNADRARPGVNDALATALGLTDLRPLEPAPAPARDKLVTFVPASHLDALVDALAAAGAGVVGGYDRCAFSGPGTGTFRAGPGTSPAVGTAGRLEAVAEQRLEMVLPRARRAAVVAALRTAHPYEEPAFDVYELAAPATGEGLGRIGELPAAEPLAAFADRVAAGLPATAHGVRVAGEPDRPVRRVAVCGGAGDSLLGAVRAAGVDAYVTADLRHHPASEAAAHPAAPALVDVAHWASEWPWLPAAAARLSAALAGSADTVEARVSHLRTDPWTWHLATPARGPAPAEPVRSGGPEPPDPPRPEGARS